MSGGHELGVGGQPGRTVAGACYLESDGVARARSTVFERAPAAPHPGGSTTRSVIKRLTTFIRLHGAKVGTDIQVRLR